MSDFISYKYSVRLAIPVFAAVLRSSLGNWHYVANYVYMNFDTEINLLLTFGEKIANSSIIVNILSKMI